MSRMDLEQVVRDTNRRLDRVEQILPTLPTREELDGRIAKLATKEELQAAILAGGVPHRYRCGSRGSSTTCLMRSRFHV